MRVLLQYVRLLQESFLHWRELAPQQVLKRTSWYAFLLISKNFLNKTSVVILLWWIKWLLKVNAAIQVTILFFQLKKGCSGSNPWNQINSAEKCWKLWWFWWTLNFESTPHLNEWLWEAAVTKPVKLVFAHPVPKQLWACFCRPTVCIIFVLGLALLIW